MATYGDIRSPWKAGTLKAASGSNITLSGEQTVDDVALVAEDECFVAGQSSGAENGPYVVKADGWVRRRDWAEGDTPEDNSQFRIAAGGTAFPLAVFECTTASVTVGTTSTSWQSAASTTLLASTSGSEGASLVGVQDSLGSLVAANVEAALSELATPLTLSAAADAGATVAVTVSGGVASASARYIARLYDAQGVLALAAAWTVTETGVGAPVFEAGGLCIFTTDASGGATLTVTDIATGTNETLWLVVEPCAASAGQYSSPGSAVACDFDT